MKVENMAKQSTIPQTVIQAAHGLLSPFYPELSPTGLIKALERDKEQPTKQKRLSPRQYAEMMGISVDTVKRLCKRGEVEWQRVGRQIRVLVEV